MTDPLFAQRQWAEKRKTSIYADNSFDAPHALYIDEEHRVCYVTNIVGEPVPGVMLDSEGDFWEQIGLAYRKEVEGYEIVELLWKPEVNDPDQLRNYEQLPFSDESEITS